MKTIALASLVAASLTFASASAQDAKTETKGPGSELKDLKAKASYTIGIQMGKNLKAQAIDLDPAVIAQGIADGLAGSKGLLNETEMKSCMEAFQTELAKKAGEVAKAAGDKNKNEGDAYLAKNKAKAGVTTTASGLQYEILREGKGAKPKASDSVKVHYSGKLLDGTEFDSSYKRNMPTSFPLARVIKGWTEGMQLMPVGSKFRFTIPSELAYGPNGNQGIAPNSVLVFDVELLGIE